MQTVDPLFVALVSALVGAGSSLGGIALTLWWTRRLEADRHEHDWVSERSTDRRKVYGRFLESVELWREACADLEGEPDEKDWDRYWAARVPALQAASELSLIAPASVVECASEAMDELLDISWDYNVTGPEFLKAALWNKIAFIDSEIEKVFVAARAEFGEGPPIPRSNRWARRQTPGQPTATRSSKR